MTTTSKVAGDALARFRLDGSVACITGGAAGIGAATAELMATAGAKVVILDRDIEAARAKAAAIGGACKAQGLDVANESAIVDTFAAVAERHGQIDILVANAGINIRRTAMACTLEDWMPSFRSTSPASSSPPAPPPDTCPSAAVPWSALPRS